MGVLYDIYAIDERIKSLIDDETGEIHEFDLLLELNMEREYLIEQTALTIKNLESTAAAIKMEADKLAAKRDAATKQAAKLREGLLGYLGEDKLVTPLVTVSTRKSNATEVPLECYGEFLAWAVVNRTDLLRYKPPEVDKAAVKAALESGETVPYAEVVQRRTLQIK